jgi:spore coat protein U-like protein
VIRRRTAGAIPRRGRRARSAAAAALVAGACLLGAASATAANCTVNAQGVVFGTYDVLLSSSLDGAGTITVSCDAFASYSLALSPGQGTMTARQLQSGSGVLAYNLYADSLRSVIWGDGTGGTGLVNGGGTGGSYTIYGRIPARQNVAAGTYSDSITVTLMF